MSTRGCSLLILVTPLLVEKLGLADRFEGSHLFSEKTDREWLWVGDQLKHALALRCRTFTLVGGPAFLETKNLPTNLESLASIKEGMPLDSPGTDNVGGLCY